MRYALSLLAAGLVTAGVANAQSMLPAAVQPPAGHSAVMTLKGTGELTYECRAKTDDAAAFEWAFVGPDARLTRHNAENVGKYYAGPTWELNDGSKITGKQAAVAPAPAGNIPYQLVKAEGGSGSLAAVTYIQRVNTKGGVAPADRCDAAGKGARKTVPYSADYVFYRAG